MSDESQPSEILQGTVIILAFIVGMLGLAGASVALILQGWSPFVAVVGVCGLAVLVAAFRRALRHDPRT